MIHDTTKLPPHSDEAERGVLGCCLLDPNECIGRCVEVFPSCEVFYDTRHQSLYKVLVSMYDEGLPIDAITIQQRLNDTRVMDEVGGILYVLQLQDATPSAANVQYYIDIVREKHVLRRTIAVCTETVAKAYEFEGDVDRLVDEVESSILKVSECSDCSESPDIGELVQKSISRMEDALNRQGALIGIATGFPDLDSMTLGLKGGEVFVLAARPSMGKTSLAMNIVENVAVVSKIPTAVFSLEMSGVSLVERMACSIARVNIQDTKKGSFKENDFPKLALAYSKINKSPLYIDEGSGLTVGRIRAKARRLHRRHGIKLIVIDYLQLLRGDNRRVENRQQEVSEISGGIKSLAKQLDIPIIVLSQLNRESDKEKSRKPRLSDLRESGSIEQDADIVGMLYKPGEDDQPSSGPCPIDLLIAKHRNGETGSIHLTFFKSFTRFESAAKITDDDLPI